VIGLRGYGQRDPLNEYKTEGYNLFEAMIARLREMVTAQVMRVEIQTRPPGDMLPDEDELPVMRAHHIDPTTGEDDVGEGALFGQAVATVQDVTAGAVKKVGRNDPCPCGSGKKYKHCHGAFA
jgi:preprotein translocase subunit SecA